MDRAEAAAARLDGAEAWRCAQIAARLAPDDAEVLALAAKAAADHGLSLPPGAEKTALQQEGLVLAERAVLLAPDRALTQLALARACGKIAQTDSSLDTRIDFAWRAKEAAERAVRLEPDNDYGLHLLGRIHAEVASQGGVRRFFAGLLVRRLPPTSLAEAERLLRRAATLRPDRTSHRIELALVLIELGRTAEARELLVIAVHAPRRELHEDESRHRGLAALNRLRQRRRASPAGAIASGQPGPRLNH